MQTRKPRVLVVDDDATIRETLAAGLELLDCEVLTARDGNEALSRAEMDSPTVIVLDLLMPRKNGLAVLEQLQACRRPGRHFVLMTGVLNEGVAQRAFDLGADACLQKTFGIPHFIQTIKDLLPAAKV